MLYQYDIAWYSVTVALCNKARHAGKGCSLFKYCNAVAEHHGNALWLSLSVSMVCVAPFDNRITIACKARLAMYTGKLAEPGSIILIEH
ncbi:hypothetical protein SAMN05421690_101624 [Nitrosomonas sp. Nm51]|nr:hypothetical protein SAMN05421690_101624 [Nitrosomonas sp. Nm51]